MKWALVILAIWGDGGEFSIVKWFDSREACQAGYAEWRETFLEMPELVANLEMNCQLVDGRWDEAGQAGAAELPEDLATAGEAPLAKVPEAVAADETGPAAPEAGALPEPAVQAAPAEEAPTAAAQTPAAGGPLIAIDGAEKTAPGAEQSAARATGQAARAFVVQLSSVTSEAGARSEWRRFQAAFPELLGGRALSIGVIDLEDRGTFYRVQTGPFADYDDAHDLCTRLKARRQPCLILRREAPGS